jgi:predicted ester cyclase
MSVEENKAVARRWNDEIWNKGNIAAVDEIMATNFVWLNAPPGVPSDLKGYKQYQTESLSSFADMNCTIEDMVAEGDKVAVRWTWSGKHTGEYMGIAPTGKRVTMTGVSIIHIVGGKIVEEWDEADNLGFMAQLSAKEG